MSRRAIALGLGTATALLMAAGIAAAIATPARLSDDGGWGLISLVVPVAAFAVVGGVIAVRRQDNRIGWLLVAIGALFAVVVASSAGSRWALGLIGTQLPLRLPDGRLPSPRWRPFSRLTIALIAVAVVGMAIQPGRVEDVAGTANPLGSETLKPLASVFLLVILCFVGSIASLVVRYRRAAAEDRIQLRWVAFAGALFLATYLVTVPLATTLGEDTTAGTLLINTSEVAFAALPIGIGYAVLRHRLYDIDALISRTLAYAGLTLTLAAAYVGSVLLLQVVLSPGSDLAIAASTLAVAALFRPARGRIQALVDRRFYRRRYDARRTLESFSSRLRDEIELDRLSSELRGVVADTMQPRHASLWQRSPRS